MIRLFLLVIIGSYCVQCVFSQKSAVVKKQVKNNSKLPVDIDYKNWTCRALETSAEFPTCDTGWATYLANTVDLDLPKKNGAAPGVYLIELYFVVLKNGSIETVTPLTKCGFGMEEEVIRAIRKSPQWRPATRNGRKMSDRRKQTFRFVVSDPLIT